MKRSTEYLRSKGVAIGKPQIHHLRVLPHSDGVTVQHMNVGKHGVAESHEFSHGQKAEFMGHMAEHAGMAGAAGEAKADSNKTSGYPEAE